LKQRILDPTQVEFEAGQKAENIYAGQGDPLKNRLIDLANVTFLAGQKAENDYAGPVDHLNIAFLPSPKSHLGQP
jgi:hypothetical protein